MSSFTGIGAFLIEVFRDFVSDCLSWLSGEGENNDTFNKLTSSRFDCLALLALWDEAASLWAPPSNLGRGMFDGLSEYAPCVLLFGVPR